MPRYRLDYYEEANMNLVRSPSGIVEAESFEAALRLRTQWPVFEARDHRSATAQNPGTCVYYTEMWEATLLDAPPAAHPSGYVGDFSRLRY